MESHLFKPLGGLYFSSQSLQYTGELLNDDETELEVHLVWEVIGKGDSDKPFMVCLAMCPVW